MNSLNNVRMCLIFFRKSYYHLVLCSLLFSGGITLNAQAPRKFNLRFGGSGYDYAYDIKQTLDKGYIIIGSTSSFGLGNTDMYLIKLDSMGQKKFETSFGNYNNDIGKSVIQLVDSSYVMLGYTNSSGFGGYDIFLVKADKNGNLLWQKTLGGTDWDFGYSLQQTLDGGFIIGGTTYSSGYGSADGYVIKTDVNGNVTWSKTFGGVNDDEFKSIIQTVDGGYALCGYTKSYADVDGDAWIFKLNGAGDSIYSTSIGGSYHDYFTDVVQLPNGNLYFVGANKSDKNGVNYVNWQYAINNITHSTTYDLYIGGNQDERYNSNAVGINSTVVSVGYHYYSGSQSDATIHLFNPDLTYMGAFFPFGLADKDELFSVTRTLDKGFAAVGTCSGNNTLLNDFLFIKTDSSQVYGTNITGIANENVRMNQVDIFPNPIENAFHLNIQNNEVENKQLMLKIFDINGRLVHTEDIYRIENEIHLHNLKTGLYFLQLCKEEKVIYNYKISIINP